MACGADTLGSTLISSLTNDAPFQIPNTTIPTAIVKVSATDLTSGVINGTGVFDKLMAGVAAHLKNEFDKNRITGAEYTKAFIASIEVALTQATAFIISCDKQYWDNLLTQQQAIVFKLQAENLLADYAVKKLQLAKLSSEFCISEYTLNNMLPKQLDMLTKQILGQDKTNSTTEYNLDNLMPAQLNLLKEQQEAARAQTSDTRSDGSAISGTLGNQKALLAQQVVSYKSDAKLKVGKIFSDTWITQKTLNDEITPPTVFTNPTVETVMTALRTDVGV
jgi:hypothetical protein